MTTEQDICCVENCNKKATNYLGNNLLKGRIPFCKDCIVLYEKHLIARERLFREEGRAEILKEVQQDMEKILNSEEGCFEDMWDILEEELKKKLKELK